MRLKRINAVLALLSSIAMFFHLGYNILSFLFFFYNPTLKILSAAPFIILTCGHAICGMCAVFLNSDGTMADTYPKLNMETVIQRVSAAFIFPLLIVHLKTFELLSSFSGMGNYVMFTLIILLQVIFYAVVLAHFAVSFPKAFITLGLLKNNKWLYTLKKASYIIAGVLFVLSVFSVIYGELRLFVTGV